MKTTLLQTQVYSTGLDVYNSPSELLISFIQSDPLRCSSDLPMLCLSWFVFLCCSQINPFLLVIKSALLFLGEQPSKEGNLSWCGPWSNGKAMFKLPTRPVVCSSVEMLEQGAVVIVQAVVRLLRVQTKPATWYFTLRGL